MLIRKGWFSKTDFKKSLVGNEVMLRIDTSLCQQTSLTLARMYCVCPLKCNLFAAI